MDDARKDLKSIIKKNSELSQTVTEFRQGALRRYFLKIKDGIQQEGWRVEKAGLLVCGENDDGDWEVTNPLIDLLPSQWQIQIMDVEHWQGPLIENRRIPLFLRHEPRHNRTVAPVLVLKKNE